VLIIDIIFYKGEAGVEFTRPLTIVIWEGVSYCYSEDVILS
jgi:hypothetical protein